MKKAIPIYYVSKNNTVLQIIFTTVFAYIFVNLYKPFGSGEWYNVSIWMFLLASGILVIAGMLVVLLSRLFMFFIKRKRPISILYYILMVAGEIIFMGAVYSFLEKVAMKDVRPFMVIFYIALLNTSLILLIPYLITILFMEWQAKKMSLEKLIQQISNKAYFISFKDKKGRLMLTLKTNDLIYLESADNYVFIHYEADGKTKKYLLRNSLKDLEQDLSDYPLMRCHRSYMINIKHVKMMKWEKGNVKLLLDNKDNNEIPVSKTYVPNVTKMFSNSLIV